MSIYTLLAILLFALGLHGLVTCRHLLRKILALNILTSGVFLLLVTLADAATPLDPVPQAMVLTGIVITVGTTAVGLTLVARLYGRRDEADGDHD